jgi:hypothetical protein
MKFLKFLLASILITSCNVSTDIETLEYDTNISDFIASNKYLKKDIDAIYGLLSYRTDELQNFRFGDVNFSKYKVLKGYNADYNDLHIYVDNYKNNNFIGLTIEIAKEEEGKKLFDYLRKKYGEPESRESQNGLACVWHNNKLNQWILINQEKRETRDNKSFLYTKCTIVKKEVRVENSNDPKVFTILDLFSLAHPKK